MSTRKIIKSIEEKIYMGMDDRRFIKLIGRVLLILLTIIVFTQTLNIVVSSFNRWQCNIEIKYGENEYTTDGLYSRDCVVVRGDPRKGY